MDLLQYQNFTEAKYLDSANFAYAKGNISGAVGFLEALAEQKHLQLPRRPMPRASQLDTMRVLERHFFRCLRILGGNTGDIIDNVRMSYSRPFQVTAVKANKETKVQPNAINNS